MKCGKSAQKYTLVSCSFLPPQPKDYFSDSGMTSILCQQILDTFSQGKNGEFKKKRGV